MLRVFCSGFAVLWMTFLLGVVAHAGAVRAPGGDQGGGVGGHGSASDSDGLGAANGTLFRLEAVNVVAEKVEAGRSTIGGQALQTIPSRTGSVTEALKVLPNVQFSNQVSSSLTLGEIAPPRISISGAKPYENSFLVDGMSVSNTLNPSGLAVDGDAPSASELQVNGADQTIFYDSSLVDSVTVYSSNIPVKYGNFLGGVVDAELVDPRLDRWHAVVEGRHTQSEWHNLRGVDADSDDPVNQPRFRTSKVQAMVDGPMSERAGLLFAASRLESVIPLKFQELDGALRDKDQYRSNENVFARMLVLPSHDLRITLDGTYAPYFEERWRKGWDDSEWVLSNRAWRFGGSAELERAWGLFAGRLVYSRNGFSRDAAENEMQHVGGDGVPESEWVNRGGLGDSRIENRALDLGFDFDMNEFYTGELQWKFSTGLSVNHAATDMWFEEGSLENRTVYASGKWTEVSAQFPESNDSAVLNTLGWYVQSEMEWGRFNIVSGLRVDYDDFSNNTNFAPRIKGEFDVLGDGTLRFVAGASRYYGGQLRDYAFKRWRPSTSTLRMSSGFEKTETGDDFQFTAAGLDTPYSNELTGAVVGQIWGLDYGLEFVHRVHRDQLVSKSFEDDVYTMTNDGKSTYDGITLTLSKSFETQRYGRHFFELGAAKSRTKTFNGAYNSEINLLKEYSGYFIDFDQVFYNGELIDRSELPADDFNAPLVLTFSWIGSFLDDKLHVNCASRWRDSTTGLKNDLRTDVETPYGTVGPSLTTETSRWLDEDQVHFHDAYHNGVISGSFVTDVSFELDAIRAQMFTLTLLLDVFNVFGGNGDTGVSEVGKGGLPLPRSQYGRAYYAGIRCEF